MAVIGSPTTLAHFVSLRRPPYRGPNPFRGVSRLACAGLRACNLFLECGYE
jgi:hypothetical protein